MIRLQSFGSMVAFGILVKGGFDDVPRLKGNFSRLKGYLSDILGITGWEDGCCMGERYFAVSW